MDVNVKNRFVFVKKSKTFNRILNFFNLSDKRVLDIGCGWGEYLALFGKGSVGITFTNEEVNYGNENNLKILKGNVEFIDEIKFEKGQFFEAIWANNLFEHLLSPHAFLIKLKTVAKDDTILILGVPVIPRIASLMKINKWRGALAGAHVNFFTRESLRLTVERAGWKVSDVRPFFLSNIILDRLASFFAPHLYVLARNDSTWKYPDKKLKEWKDEPHYNKMLEITGSR